LFACIMFLRVFVFGFRLFGLERDKIGGRGKPRNREYDTSWLEKSV